MNTFVNCSTYSTSRLAPILLPTGTHCWQRLCRQPDNWNSTGIPFDLLCWIDLPTESIIPSSTHYHTVFAGGNKKKYVYLSRSVIMLYAEVS